MEVEIENIDSEQMITAGLAEFSLKTGLIVRAIGSVTVEGLFAEIEKYDSHERAETFEYVLDTVGIGGPTLTGSSWKHFAEQRECWFRSRKCPVELFLLLGRSSNSAPGEWSKKFFGVCLVSIIGKHQRD